MSGERVCTVWGIVELLGLEPRERLKKALSSLCLFRGRVWIPPHMRMRKALATLLLTRVEWYDLEQSFSVFVSHGSLGDHIKSSYCFTRSVVGPKTAFLINFQGLHAACTTRWVARVQEKSDDASQVTRHLGKPVPSLIFGFFTFKMRKHGTEAEIVKDVYGRK